VQARYRRGFLSRPALDVPFHRPRRRLTAAAAVAVVCALHAVVLVLLVQGQREAQQVTVVGPPVRLVARVVVPWTAVPVEPAPVATPAPVRPRPTTGPVATGVPRAPVPSDTGMAVVAAPPAASGPDTGGPRLQVDVRQAELASRAPNEALKRQPGATAQDKLALGIVKSAKPDCLRGGDERSMSLGLLALPFVVRDVLSGDCR